VKSFVKFCKTSKAKISQTQTIKGLLGVESFNLPFYYRKSVIFVEYLKNATFFLTKTTTLSKLTSKKEWKDAFFFYLSKVSLHEEVILLKI
jgi:hypothetical protein